MLCHLTIYRRHHLQLIHEYLEYTSSGFYRTVAAGASEEGDDPSCEGLHPPPEASE